MKECDEGNSHISSKPHIIYITKYTLFYHKDTAISHRLCGHKTHCTFSLSVNIVTNSVQRRQRQTLRRCDLERALGGDTWCVKKKTVMESVVATFSVLYCKSAILLTFNILALFYENPVFEINLCCVCSWHQ